MESDERGDVGTELEGDNAHGEVVFGVCKGGTEHDAGQTGNQRWGSSLFRQHRLGSLDQGRKGDLTHSLVGKVHLCKSRLTLTVIIRS